MIDAHSMIAGPVYARPKVNALEPTPKPEELAFEFNSGRRQRKRPSKYDAVIPKVGQMYKAGATYEEIAAGCSMPKAQVHMIVQMLIRRGQIVPRRRRTHEHATAKPVRQRPLAKFVDRDWNALRLTPCRSVK